MDPRALINTTAAAPRQAEMLQRSAESWAYHRGEPYPTYAFSAKQWPPDKGPIPTPLPYVGVLLSELAEFTFRNGAPQFSVPAEEDAALQKVDEWLQGVIVANGLPEQWISLAEHNGNQGAIAAKFSYDGNDPDRPVRINFLDIPTECRVWFDPHASDRMLLARIQYPYRDPSDGKWYYFREEWTDELWVTYKPLLAGDAAIAVKEALPGYTTHLGDQGKWEVETADPNPFGLIPLTVIRNRREKGNPFGVGDCWDSFRLIDRIALTLHGEDRSNQLHSDPALVIENGDIDDAGPLQGNEALIVKSNDPESKPATAKLLEPSGAAREFSHRSMDRWEDLLYKRVGVSRIDTATVSNKGNMTALAFAMTFARTIASADRKRELWGASGMAPFFKRMILGVANAGVVRDLGSIDPQKLKVSCEWPKYFEATDEDLKALTDRTASQVAADFLTPERGAERIAKAEKVPGSEIKTLLDELAAQRGQKEAERKAFAMGDRMLDRFDRGQDGSEEEDDEAASGGTDPTGGGADRSPEDLAKLANAAGILIRSGFDPAAALASVGLDPIKHLGLLPVTLQSKQKANAKPNGA